MGIKQLGPLGKPVRSSRRRQRQPPRITEERESDEESEGEAWLSAEHMFTPWQLKQLHRLRRWFVAGEGWVVGLHLCTFAAAVWWLCRLFRLYSLVVESI